MPQGRLRIGTSNMVLPGNRSTFPPDFQAGSRLHYYSSLFNTVELNTTFYKVPKKETFIKWAADVPDDFRFSIKLSKAVTHAKELNITLEDIDLFMVAAEGLKDKKGCLLIQFPGKISLAYYTMVEDIIAHIDRLDGCHDWRKAVEFRNPSWYVSETYELLNEYDTTLVLHDIPKSRNSSLSTRTDLAYVRFHGEAGDYRGSYAREVLLAWHEEIKEWLENGIDVYAYFNNTIGAAFENARMLANGML